MKIGIIFGAWDLLHAGHLSILETAKSRCDHLIVGLHIDPSTERSTKNKPVESLLERQMRLRSCRYVDEVIVYETEKDLSEILKSILIHERYIGSDYHGMKALITDPDIIPLFEIESRPIHSSNLRERIKNS